MIVELFKKLGERLRKENHLSDITWAFCESNSDFKKLFLTFFFDKDFANISHNKFSEIELKREVAIADSRPDFRFIHDNNEYIIEVKIHDQNDHFIQYKITFPNASFGWIANYKTNPQEGIEIRTWQEFSKFIEIQILKSNFNDESKNLISAYNVYLKNVCIIIEIKKMKLHNLTSLQDFYHLSEKILDEPFDGFESHFEKIYCTQYYSGAYSHFHKTGSPKPDINPLLAVYYNNEKAGIGVMFHKYYTSDSVMKGLAKNEFELGKYFTKPYPVEGHYWIELSHKYFDEFNHEETSLERQIDILKSFYQEVMKFVYQFIE